MQLTKDQKISRTVHRFGPVFGLTEEHTHTANPKGFQQSEAGQHQRPQS